MGWGGGDGAGVCYGRFISEKGVKTWKIWNIKAIVNNLICENKDNWGFYEGLDSMFQFENALL